VWLCAKKTQAVNDLNDLSLDESFDLKNRQCCLCSSAVNWGPRILSTSTYPLFKPSLRSLIERVFIRSDRCLQSGSFSYCRLDIPTRPPAAARDGNENPRPPSSTSIRYRENGKLLSFKGEELSYWLSNASVLSEFLLPLDLLPFLPYLVIPFFSATKFAAVPPHVPTSLFFLDLLPIY
jgi:hypothetical protein